MMMDIKEKNLGRYKFEVRMDQAGASGDCRIVSMGDMMIHSASLHARELGFGVTEMIGRGLAWVVVGLAVEMRRMPRFLDDIWIGTWMERRMRSVVVRNFIVYDANNEVIGGGSTQWAVIDFKKRTMADVTNLGLEKHSRPVPDIIGGVQAAKPSKGDLVAEEVIQYSDIDLNGHMYSLKYVEHAIDTLPMQQVITAPPMRFDVSYHHEVRGGEQIKIYRSEDPAVRCFTICRGDGKPASVVKLG